MTTRRWTFVLTIPLIAGLAYAGWAAQQQSAALAQGAPQETATVQRGTLSQTIEGTGSLVPCSEVTLAFLTGGTAAEVMVGEGDTVEVGQPLVRLATDELESEVAQAEAQMASAQASLAQFLADPRGEDVAELESNLEAAQAQVAAAAARRNQTLSGPSQAEIAEAQAQVAAAEADHREALIKFDETKSEDEDAKEQARYDLWAAELALDATQIQLAELEAGPDDEDVRETQADVAEAVKRRDAAQAQLELLLAGPTDEQVEGASARVDQAGVALQRARLQLERAELTAPISGTVVSLRVEPGETAAAGQAVAVLNDLSCLEVEINLDEMDVVHVSTGQSAQIDLEAFPELSLDGEVTHIAPKAETGSGLVFFPVTVQMLIESNPGSEGHADRAPSGTIVPAKVGMTADVELVADRREDALIVPLRAIYSEGDQAYVKRYRDGQIERVDVSLGMVTDSQAEIVSGRQGRALTEGDTVVVVPGPEPDAGGFRVPSLFGGN